MAATAGKLVSKPRACKPTNGGTPAALATRPATPRGRSEGEFEALGDLRLDRLERIESCLLRQFANRLGLAGDGVETRAGKFALQGDIVGEAGNAERRFDEVEIGFGVRS